MMRSWNSRNHASGSRAPRTSSNERRAYPAELDFKLRKIRRRDDLVVTEYNISYDGNPWQFCVSIMEFVDDKVAHEHIYIMEGWDAPDWRSPLAL